MRFEQQRTPTEKRGPLAPRGPGPHEPVLETLRVPKGQSSSPVFSPDFGNVQPQRFSVPTRPWLEQTQYPFDFARNPNGQKTGSFRDLVTSLFWSQFSRRTRRPKTHSQIPRRPEVFAGKTLILSPAQPHGMTSKEGFGRPILISTSGLLKPRLGREPHSKWNENTGIAARIGRQFRQDSRARKAA